MQDLSRLIQSKEEGRDMSGKEKTINHRTVIGKLGEIRHLRIADVYDTGH